MTEEKKTANWKTPAKIILAILGTLLTIAITVLEGCQKVFGVFP